MAQVRTSVFVRHDQDVRENVRKPTSNAFHDCLIRNAELRAQLFYCHLPWNVEVALRERFHKCIVMVISQPITSLISRCSRRCFSTGSGSSVWIPISGTVRSSAGIPVRAAKEPWGVPGAVLRARSCLQSGVQRERT